MTHKLIAPTAAAATVLALAACQDPKPADRGHRGSGAVR
jgi:hypothetical protein